MKRLLMQICPSLGGLRLERFVAHAVACVGALSCLSPVQAERVPWTSSKVVGSPEPPAKFRVERVFPQLNFAAPVDLQAVPGENLFFLLQQDGKILSFPSDPTTRATNVVLDIRAHHQPFDNALGFTLHPEFASNRYLYVNYNEPGGATNGAYVARFTVGRGDQPKSEWSSRSQLLTWMSGGHNGSQLLFGPDKMLYISTGDASPPDPPDIFRTGQGVDDLLSSVLRIDPDHPSEGRPYGIPAGNPFVGVAGARPEVWAFGFRNPWRMSFAPDGALWLGDVGWELWELLHRVTPGYNGGWSYVEGPNASVRNDVTPGPTAVHKPLIALPHSEAASITGGRFYRGSKLPELKGAYIFADWETGKFWSVRAEGEKVTEFKELCDTTLKPVSFAESPSGELLIVDYIGGLYELARNEAPDESARFPRKLSATGLFGDALSSVSGPIVHSLRSPMAALGVWQYEINMPMWADHATARQWIAIPGSGTAKLTDKWSYPTNTVFAKTLSLRMDTSDNTSERRIETQLLQFDGQTWHAYSYRWNTEQTDAELVSAEGATLDLTVRDPEAPGGKRQQTWRFHSRTECLRCHNPWAGNAIGFSLEQLNQRGQIESMEQKGLIELVNPKKPFPRLAPASSPGAPEPALARSWLHANCAHCHRFGAGGSVATFLNYEVDDLGTRTVDERPLRGGFGLEAARVVASGDPSRSALFYRINTEGQGHMPHIGSRTVDPRGVQWVSKWILGVGPSTNAPDAEARAAAGRVPARRFQSLVVIDGDSDAVKKDLPKLVSSTSGALSLLEALFAGGTAKPSASLVQAASQSPNPMVRDLFDRFLPPDQRRKVLGDAFNPQVVLSLKGDADRGRKLFHAEGGVSCSRCHALEGQGRAYGPDLTLAVKKYPVAGLLDQILQPSRVIAPEFVLHQVEMKSGGAVNGFIVRRNTDGFVIRSEDLTEREVKRSEVESDTQSPASAMPDGLLSGLTAQEAADLLAYLSAVATKR